MTTRPLSAFCLAIALAVSGPAVAEEGPPASIGEAIGRLFEGANLRTPRPPPAEFVVRSRPAELDYAPLAPPGRKAPTAKNAEELQKLKSELAAAAASNRRRAARVKVPEGGASPKARGP